ncbi:MAG TPA: hypothetical protein VM266_10010 [Solirubrobacteraceae bacterium]|nr:hypothetical protein [Solirubrobacteraceae bacterium]
MHEPRDPHERTPAERLVRRDIADHGGRPLSNASRQIERSVDSYLRAGVRPRWMERLIEIERGTKRARRELERAYWELREACAGDRAAFRARWREVAARWDFEEINELVRTHNEWYPVERNLPINPRTGDYVLLTGRPYTRRELDTAWVLEQFPA